MTLQQCNSTGQAEACTPAGRLRNSFGAAEHQQVPGNSDGAEETEVAERSEVVPPVDGVTLVENEIFADHFCHGRDSNLI